MANAYIQGKDRVAADESFPYPIKLTYDDEYIYLTVLRIPTLEEIAKMNSFAANGVKQGMSLNLNRLWLCVEVEDTRSGNGGTVYSERFMNQYYDSKHINGRVSSKGGRFKRRLNSELYNNVIVGQTYTFTINSTLNSIAIWFKNLSLEGNIDQDASVFIKVRGAFRYGPSSMVDTNVQPSRTSIHSNVAIIPLKYRGR